jgi:excisionase family DNA binding protein
MSGSMLTSRSREFLTVRQAAEILSFSTRHVRRLIVQGELIAHRFGRSIRITAASLDAYVARGRI